MSTSFINRSWIRREKLLGFSSKAAMLPIMYTRRKASSLLIRELHHRVKNTLATVQAILGATARSSLNIADFHEAFAGRLISLGKTHTILTESQRQDASVHELLRLELDPYDDATGRRMKLEGPDVRLPADPGGTRRSRVP